MQMLKLVFRHEHESCQGLLGRTFEATKAVRFSGFSGLQSMCQRIEGPGHSSGAGHRDNAQRHSACFKSSTLARSGAMHGGSPSEPAEV